jgi:hypothetical protein
MLLSLLTSKSIINYYETESAVELVAQMKRRGLTRLVDNLCQLILI